jgi:hypothetical protein
MPVTMVTGDWLTCTTLVYRCYFVSVSVMVLAQEVPLGRWTRAGDVNSNSSSSSCSSCVQAADDYINYSQ